MPGKSGPRRSPAAVRPRKAPGRSDAIQRQRLCAEAARIMAEEGVKDHLSAKRKAAERLGLAPTTALPSNQEIEAALTEYLQLFHGHRLQETLKRLRQLALEAMGFLEPFEPLLLGAALNGSVTPGAEIQLHVTADTPEEVGLYLLHHHIPYEETDRRLRFGGDRYQRLPAYRFLADTIPVEICVFSRKSVREAPLSPVDGKPAKRINRKELQLLVEKGG